MSRGTADNRATADREAERDRTAEDALGIYSGGLQKEKIDTSKNIDLADPKPLRLAHTNFEQGEDLFKDLRKDLRKHGYNGLAEEIKDLRAERSKALEGITDRLYQGVMCLSDLLSKVPVEEIDDAPENKILKRAFDEIPRLIDQYNALIDDEAKFVDTALANLRGWQSATGDDVREVKTAAESADANATAAKTAAEGAEQVAKDTHGLLSSFLAAAPEWLKRAVSRISFGKDPLYRARRKAVCDKWLEFKGGECDTERPDGTLRTAGGKRTYKEFREAYRDVVVFNGKTLGTLYPDGEGYPEDESYRNLAKDIGGEVKRHKRAKQKKPS